MIKYTKYKCLRDMKGAAFAHGCNTLGVMGAGVAAEVRSFDQYLYDSYREYCAHAEADDIMGTCFTTMSHGVTIFNCFTQQTIGRGNDAKLSAIDGCLAEISRALKSCSTLKEIYFPRIGCGLGGLNWDTQVKGAMEAFAACHPDVTVYIVDMVTAKPRLEKVT